MTCLRVSALLRYFLRSLTVISLLWGIPSIVFSSICSPLGEGHGGSESGLSKVISLPSVVFSALHVFIVAIRGDLYEIRRDYNKKVRHLAQGLSECKSASKDGSIVAWMNLRAGPASLGMRSLLSNSFPNIMSSAVHSLLNRPWIWSDTNLQR